MQLKIVAGNIIFLLLSCSGGHSSEKEATMLRASLASPEQPAEVSAIALPAGYHRTAAGRASFAAWLRTQRLKKNNTVYLYDGSLKLNQDAQFAVLDISVGDKNLQQCADAVMRLRAEYLFSLERYREISFTDNEGTVYNFTAPYTKDRFYKYLEKVFGMCGSASLSKQMKQVNMRSMQPGDVLIKGGFPGHAVIVMDMAENDEGEKIYLLAQSYMPAQDIHILKNPGARDGSPWYHLTDDAAIVTPEYYFTNDQLKSW